MKYIIIIMIVLQSTCFAWTRMKYEITHYHGGHSKVYKVNHYDTHMSSVQFMFNGEKIELFGNMRIVTKKERK